MRILFFVMYLIMNTEVTVGDVVFGHIHSAVIKQGINHLTDTACVTISKNYKLKDKSVLDYINAGDAATIKLGYNGLLYEEFTGYVREINTDIPMVLHLDDEMYQLKQGNFVKAWKEVSLLDMLTTIAPDYTIDCPDVNLGKFQIDNASAFKVLQELKNQYGFYSWIKESTLHCGFAYDQRENVGSTHVYKFGRNIPKGGNKLKFQRKEDYKVKIRAISNKQDGTKLKVEVGSTENNASVRTLNFGDKTKTELKELANQELARLCFDGYGGSIKGMGSPRTKAGDALELVGMPDDGGNGTYLIEAVTIKWGIDGFSRENKLSFKI